MSGIQRNSVKKMLELDQTPLIVRLPMSRIELDPDQPRQEGKHTPEEVKALGKSMRVKQLQPATVRVYGKDGKGDDLYRVVIGEGRWRGAAEEGLEFLDCVITEETDPVKIKVMQIVENLLRKDMSKLDYAKSFQDLLDTGVCETAEDVADLCNCSTATVSVYLAVLNAPPEVKELVSSGIATPDTARTLLDVQERSPEKAAELIEQGKADGKLKRDDVRAAQHELKAQAGEAPPAKRPKGAAKPAAPTAAPASPPKRTQDDSAHLDAASEDAERDRSKEPIVASECDIYVGISESSAARDYFAGDVKKHGIAQLENNLVHTNPEMAWVIFGRGTDTSMIAPYRCSDLVILKITSRT